MINVTIGDVEIKWGDEVYQLHPSFFSMQRLGTPKELMLTAEFCITGLVNFERGLNVLKAEISSCMEMISACCDSNMPDELLGYFDENGSYIEGAIIMNDLLVLANHLVKYGINGEPSQYMIRRAQKHNKGQQTDFDPLAFVYSAIVHLGVSREEAWRMNMLEYQRAMEAKFPPDDKEKAPSMTNSDLTALKKRLKRGR